MSLPSPSPPSPPPTLPARARQLSRKSATVAAHRTGAGASTGADPPIRSHRGTVAVSSGPPPITKTAATKGNTLHKGETPSEDQAAPGLLSSPATNGAPDDAGTAVDGNKNSVSAAGHTHDKGYTKWDKFDVDAALRDVDEETRGSEQARRQLQNV